jgi:hypothetical protein
MSRFCFNPPPAVGLNQRSDAGARLAARTTFRRVGTGSIRIGITPEFLRESEWASGGNQGFGEIFPANVWVTIFPSCTMKVSVPTSKWLSAVSAFHTM